MNGDYPEIIIPGAFKADIGWTIPLTQDFGPVIGSARVGEDGVVTLTLRDGSSAFAALFAARMRSGSLRERPARHGSRPDRDD